MNCPEATIKACFLYLDRIEKEGKLLLKDGDIEKIIKNVEDEFVNFSKSVQKYENKIKKLPYPKLPQFHIISKYLISGSNYIKTNGAMNAFDNTRKIISLKSKNDIKADIEIFTASEELKKELKDKIVEGITLANENLVYFGVDSISKGFKNIETIITNHINSYLEQYHGENSVFEKEEKKDLLDIMIGTALGFSKNEYMSSNGNAPMDYKMLLDEKTIDDIQRIITNVPRLKNTIDREYVDIEGMLNFIKDKSNYDFKEFLINIPLLRSSSHKVLIDEFTSRYQSESNLQFIEGFQKAKDMHLEVKYNPANSQFNFFYNQGTKNLSEIKLVTISTNLEYLTDDLNRKDIKKVIPTEVILDVSKTLLSASYRFNENTPLIRKCSEQSARKYFYNSNLSDGRIAIEVVDESDNAQKGNGATVMRNIAKNAENIVIMTGTGITGTAKSIVGQIAYSGTIDNIEELERQYTELCGVFEIKSPYVRLLTSLVKNDSETATYFKNSVIHTNKLFQKKDGINLNDFYNEFTKTIIQKCSLMGLNVEDINIFDAKKNTKAVLEFIIKDKDINRNDMNGIQLIEHCLFSSKSNFVKEVSGIQAGILTSLINSQSDTNIGITTRENLTGLKENINFVDSNIYHNLSKSIASKNEFSIEDVLDKNNLATKLQKEYLYKSAERNYTSQIYTFLKTNFDFFIEALKNKDKDGLRNLEIVSAVAKQTENSFIFNISKSGTSTNDDVSNLYAEYLANNGELSKKTLLKLKSNAPDESNNYSNLTDEEIKKAKRYEENRKKYIRDNGLTEEEILTENLNAFHACIEIFQKEFLEKTVFLSDVKESGIGKDNDEIKNQFDYKMNYYLPNELYNLYGDSTSLPSFVKFKNGYPYKQEDDSKIIFSVPITFMKENWKDITKEPISYKASLTNSTIKDIIDNFSSKGKEKLFYDKIVDKKENTVILSSRKTTSVFNLFDTIYAASQRREEGKPLIILVVSTPEIEKAIQTISDEFLKLHNINIQTVGTNNVASEIKRIDSLKIQYAIISNYEPVSRGLSLANTQASIFTDAIVKKGNGIQALERAIDPSRKKLSTFIYLFNGGENIELSVMYSASPKEINNFLSEASALMHFRNGSLCMSDENDELESYALSVAKNNKLCKIDRTYTDKINSELKEANKIHMGFISGKYADTKKTSFNNMLVVTELYEEKLQSMFSGKDAELDIDNLYTIPKGRDA